MGKHWDIAKEAYYREKEALAKKVSVEQKDFLPAALAILEKPASPLGSFTIWLLCSFFVIVLVWSIVGKIDVVAVAQGKVVPIGQSKVIQTSELGVVRHILVKNGSFVRKGDKLIALDATSDIADVTRLSREKLNAELIVLRNQWLLTALGDKVISLALPDQLPENEKNLQVLLATSQHDEYSATQAAYDERVYEKEAEYRVSAGQLSKIKETLPLLEEQVEGLAELSKQGITARFQYLEREEVLLSRRKDLSIEHSRLEQMSAGVRSINKQKEQHRQEYRKLVISELADASNQVMALHQEIVKAEQAERLRTLYSPVDGIVQQLAVHTIGGVVRAGDPLMIVVPSAHDLQVEANILNKDIGFVRVGQEVEIKLEAFPFTKYGVIHGKLISIDRDAVQHEELGLIYPARISMSESSLLVRGEKILLSSGMGLGAEIKTGKRRIVEFVLAPLFRYKSESLRER